MTGAFPLAAYRPADDRTTAQGTSAARSDDMSDTPASSPVLVISGMHRSGTSYAASLVHSAGLFLGNRLLGADATNSRGHFEDLEFLEFHQFLLQEHGLADEGFLADGVIEPAAVFREQAQTLLAERRALGRPWGWKDPRTVLLLDFWDSLLPDARYLFVFRPAWDVIDSLYRRGDTSFVANPPFALAVWLHSNRLICDFARRHPDRVLVREVSQLAVNPAETLDALRTRLGILLGQAAPTFASDLLSSAPPQHAAFLATAVPACGELLAELRGLAGIAPLPHAVSSTAAALAAPILDHGLIAWQRARALERDAHDAGVRIATLETEHAARDAASSTTTRGLEDELAATRRIAHNGSLRITALEQLVEGMRSSTSWRLSAPLRALSFRLRDSRLPSRISGQGRFILRRLASPSIAVRSLSRAATVLRSQGVAGLMRAVNTARTLEGPIQPPSGPTTIQRIVRMPLEVPRSLRSTVGEGPVVSVLMPVFDTPAEVLEATIDSVLAQSSSRWELVVVDDASSARHVPEILARYAARDPRIRVHCRGTNGGISAATNDALARATGEFVAFLDHDDLLDPNAVARCSAALRSTGADAVYTDQDTIDRQGRRGWTFHKPDWSPEYLRHVMYVGHMLVVRRSLANRLGGFRREFDGVQDFEFMLRLGEATPAVAHLPEVLYHWRAIDGSLAAASDAKHGIDGLQAGAVQAHLDRLGIPATATAHPRFRHRCVVSPKLARFPRVSIVIPTKDQPGHIGGCLASIFAKTRYPDFEVVVVDNGTTDERAAAMLRAHPVRVVPFTSSFNFSAASNAGAAAATGEVLVFLNNDTTVISSDWLEHLVFHLVAADVGAVGPLLLYPDGSVQHAGVVLGARGTADHVMRRFPADADGYAGSLSCPREVSAVTGACLAIRRDAFVRVGGWNELYATHYQDVDLCLRLRRAGLRIIFTPDARLTHHESPSRGDRYDLLDRLLLIDTWKDELAAGDSAYPAACSLERLDYSPRDPALEVCRA